MNTVPLVSIVCTTYNHERYIRQALDGFIMQKCNFPIEIIVHDDASTDGTSKIILEYAKKYSIINSILQTENQWSKGIATWKYLFTDVAKGKYIAICEGDDYWIDPLKLQKQVDFLEANSNYGLVLTDINIFHQKNQRTENAIFQNKKIPLYTSFEEH